MFVSPIIERELRVALRKHGAVKSRFKTAAGGAAVVCAFLLLGLLTGSSKIGKPLHTVLFLGGLYMAVIPPLRLSVGLFCEERRNQTLELLYLTGMGSAELFLGKLLGGVLIASSELLALTPFLAVPFLCGGVSLNLFLATAACFPVLLLFTVSVGVLASVWCRDDGAALIAAVALGGIICAAVQLPYFLGRTIAGTAPFSAHWLCLSPVAVPYLVWTNFAGATPKDFWITAGVTVLWTLACLGAAAMSLNRNWRQEIVRNAPTGWEATAASWVHGPAAWRAGLRERLLRQNPFQWLAQQDRRPVILAWVFIGLVAGLWLLGWWAWPHFWPSPVNLYITAFLLGLGADLIMRYAAARPMARERREGSLELLLTTPLQPVEMLEGQVAAMRAQFQPVRYVLAGLFLLMMAGGYFTRTWTNPALVSYLLIWCFFLISCLRVRPEQVPRSMWIGLNMARPTFAVFHWRKKQNNRWWWIWVAINLQNAWRGLLRAGSFPSGSVVEVFLVVLVFSLYLIYVIVRAIKPLAEPLRARLITEMRLIARLPLPDLNDPRFKQWNLQEQAPMSAHVQTFPERMAGSAGRQLGRQWGRWRTRRWGR